MKKIVISMVGVFSLYLVSCTPDKKDDPLAPSPTGDVRDKYVGTWQCNENSQIAVTSFTINITKSTSNTSEILIEKFYNLIIQPRAVVSGNNITIPYQNCSSTAIIYSPSTGTLSASGNNISMKYIVETPGNLKDTCTAICTKL